MDPEETLMKIIESQQNMIQELRTEMVELSKMLAVSENKNSELSRQLQYAYAELQEKEQQEPEEIFHSLSQRPKIKHTQL